MKAVVVFVLAAAVASHAAEITVEAGDYDRRETVVEGRMPAGVSGLVSADQSLVVQHGTDGRAWFIVRGLKRGEQKTYQFVKADGFQDAQAKPAPGGIILSRSGKTALVYRTEKTDFPPNRPDLKEVFHRGGYIH